MLPTQAICRQKIRKFKVVYPKSLFDSFWQYKMQVESAGGSILDRDHIDDTATHLSKMLDHPGWELSRLGVPSVPSIRRILKGIAEPYEVIRKVALGQGIMSNVKSPLAEIYTGLTGISHTRWADPDEFGSYYIMGKSKVLMFIWGQTPGFDSKVRARFDSWTHPPFPSLLPHLCEEDVRYMPNQYCAILEELDQWVQAWPTNNGRNCFGSLCPEWPVGRIIDVVYYS